MPNFFDELGVSALYDPPPETCEFRDACMRVLRVVKAEFTIHLSTFRNKGSGLIGMI
jgi:hypothetical protein